MPSRDIIEDKLQLITPINRNERFFVKSIATLQIINCTVKISFSSSLDYERSKLKLGFDSKTTRHC